MMKFILEMLSIFIIYALNVSETRPLNENTLNAVLDLKTHNPTFAGSHHMNGADRADDADVLDETLKLDAPDAAVARYHAVHGEDIADDSAVPDAKLKLKVLPHKRNRKQQASLTALYNDECRPKARPQMAYGQRNHPNMDMADTCKAYKSWLNEDNRMYTVHEILPPPIFSDFHSDAGEDVPSTDYDDQDVMPDSVAEDTDEEPYLGNPLEQPTDEDLPESMDNLLDDIRDEKLTKLFKAAQHPQQEVEDKRQQNNAVDIEMVEANEYDIDPKHMILIDDSYGSNKRSPFRERTEDDKDLHSINKIVFDESKQFDDFMHRFEKFNERRQSAGTASNHASQVWQQDDAELLSDNEIDGFNEEASNKEAAQNQQLTNLNFISTSNGSEDIQGVHKIVDESKNNEALRTKDEAHAKADAMAKSVEDMEKTNNEVQQLLTQAAKAKTPSQKRHDDKECALKKTTNGGLSGHNKPLQKNSAVSEKYVNVLHESQKLEKEKALSSALEQQPEAAATPPVQSQKDVEKVELQQVAKLKNRKADIQYEVAKAVNNVISEFRTQLDGSMSGEGTEHACKVSNGTPDINKDNDDDEPQDGEATDERDDQTKMPCKDKQAEQRAIKIENDYRDTEMPHAEIKVDINVHDKTSAEAANPPTLHTKFLQKVHEDNQKLQQQQAMKNYQNLSEIEQLLEQEYAMLQTLKKGNPTTEEALDNYTKVQKQLEDNKIYLPSSAANYNNNNNRMQIVEVEKVKLHPVFVQETTTAKSYSDTEAARKETAHVAISDNSTVVHRFLQEFEDHDKRVQQEIEKAVKNVILNMQDDQRRVKSKQFANIDKPETVKKAVQDNRKYSNANVQPTKTSPQSQAMPAKASDQKLEPANANSKTTVKSTASVAATAAASTAPAASKTPAIASTKKQTQVGDTKSDSGEHKRQYENLLKFLTFIGKNTKIKEEFEAFIRQQQQQLEQQQQQQEQQQRALSAGNSIGSIVDQTPVATQLKVAPKPSANGKKSQAPSLLDKLRNFFKWSKSSADGNDNAASKLASDNANGVENPVVKVNIDQIVKNVIGEVQNELDEQTRESQENTAHSPSISPSTSSSGFTNLQNLLLDKKYSYDGLVDIGSSWRSQTPSATRGASTPIDATDEFGLNKYEDNIAVAKDSTASNNERLAKLWQHYKRNRKEIELLKGALLNADVPERQQGILSNNNDMMFDDS